MEFKLHMGIRHLLLIEVLMAYQIKKNVKMLLHLETLRFNKYFFMLCLCSSSMFLSEHTVISDHINTMKTTFFT